VLRWRLAAAAAILVPLIALLYADLHFNHGAPGIWIAPLGLLIGLMAASETLDLLKTPGYRPLAWSVYLGVALVILASCAPMAWGLMGRLYPPNCPFGKLGWPLLAMAFSFMVAFVGEMRRFEQAGGVMVNLGLSVLTIVYVGLSIAFAALVRQFHSNAWGMAALVSVVFVVKISDSGAYFVGKSFGRNKLAPRISPGKTIEGGIGGMLAAVAAAWVFFLFIAPQIVGTGMPRLSWWGVTFYGVVLAIVGLIGDLSESLMKRDVARKDSSSWLPGLGGVLDIMDSLFFAMPAAYVCWAAGIVGPN
jgi:phosphatidate cytidylyltransferase